MLPKRNLAFIKQDPETPKTVLVMVTGLLILSYIFSFPYLVIAATVIGFLYIVSKNLQARIVWFWYKIAEVLGWINARILLSLIYFLVVTPVGILFRLFGNDPLLLKKPKGSFYTIREHSYKKEDLKNPW